MEITATAELERCFAVAQRAGCPADQVERFVAAGYVPQPKQWAFHAAARLADLPDGPDEIYLGGSRGPGKSHAVLAQVGIDDMQRMPGSKWLFLRKIQKSAKESFEDLISRVLGNIDYRYLPSERKIVLPNKSRCIFGGFKDERDIDAYLGIEYDGIAIEEATQLAERKQTMIRGSLRTSKDNWRPRLYLTFNPGGVGHQYVRTRAVLPYRAGKETVTRFIPSTYRDNAFINVEYKRWLESLTGPLARAWRDGDMDVFEGQAFMSFDYDRHVVDPFEIPGHWSRYRGIDWGYSSPMGCLWAARNPDNGRWVIYREMYINPPDGDTSLTDRQQAAKIVELTDAGEKIMQSYADPSMWAKDKGDGTSSAEIYGQNGVYLTPANNDRLDGKRRIDRMLADLADGKPGLLIFRNCVNLVRTLPLLVYDEKRVEDVDTTQEDHLYDCLRYVTTPAKDTKKTETQPQRSPLMGVKGL